MKRFTILLTTLLWLYGCGEVEITDQLSQLITAQPTAQQAEQATVISPIPPEIQTLIFESFGTREALIERLANIEHGEPDWEARIGWLLRVIAKIDQQYIYYDKYIDANGIAIIGHETVPDTHLLAARDIVLEMTAKHPVIRKRLSPTSNIYGNSRPYQVLLFAYDGTARELPEFRLRPEVVKYMSGTCSNFCYSSIFGGAQNFDMQVFVHEFGHAIHHAISLGTDPLDATFNERLKKAYDTAMQQDKWQGSHASTNFIEYWAVGVEYWYYLSKTPITFANRAEFAEYDPLLYQLLSEWLNEGEFPKSFG